MNSALLSLRFHICKLEKQGCSLPLSIMGRIDEVFGTIVFKFRGEAHPLATWTARRSAGQFVCLVTEMPGVDGRRFCVKSREDSILTENSQTGLLGADPIGCSSQGTLSAVLSPPTQMSLSSSPRAHPERGFTKCQDTVTLTHSHRKQ